MIAHYRPHFLTTLGYFAVCVLGVAASAFTVYSFILGF